VNTPTKLGAYALGLALAFVGAIGVGRAVGPVEDDGGSEGHQAGHDPGHGGATGQSVTAGEVPGGLAVSQGGYTLRPAAGILPVGQPTPFRFTITGPDGQPVTRYTPEHDKDLHLIVVRRDMSAYQHLHPTLGADGVWSQELTLPAAGDYRVFADFVPAAEAAQPLTLGVDLHAAGDYQPQPLPAPSRTAAVDGYTVTLAGDLHPGQASPVTLAVSKDGRPVTDLQPYLAAYGHLVALRQGDLAYLHVHPEGHPGDGTTPAGPEIRFVAEVPTAGVYRLYLDFQHAGVVRTAEFTVAATGSSPSPSPTAGHDDDRHTHER